MLSKNFSTRFYNQKQLFCIKYPFSAIFRKISVKYPLPVNRFGKVVSLLFTLVFFYSHTFELAQVYIMKISLFLIGIVCSVTFSFMIIMVAIEPCKGKDYFVFQVVNRHVYFDISVLHLKSIIREQFIVAFSLVQSNGRVCSLRFL